MASIVLQADQASRGHRDRMRVSVRYLAGPRGGDELDLQGMACIHWPQ